MNRQSKERKPLLQGQKFERLTVIGLDHQEEYHRKDGQKEFSYFYKLKCDCGNIIVREKKNLARGFIKSCGCLAKEVSSKMLTTHGKTNTQIFNAWQSMKIRCTDKNDVNYHNYGGRGIKVCQEWLDDFMNFYNWSIANGYKENQKLSIDRIDNNKGYCPENCRWTDVKTQARNRRTNVNVTYKGKTQCISAWAEELGIEQGLLRNRLTKQHLSIEEAIAKEKYPTYTYNGMTKTLNEWAELMNLQPYNLYYRLSAGWDIGKALNTPVRHKNRKAGES